LGYRKAFIYIAGVLPGQCPIATALQTRSLLRCRADG